MNLTYLALMSVVVCQDDPVTPPPDVTPTIEDRCGTEKQDDSGNLARVEQCSSLVSCFDTTNNKADNTKCISSNESCGEWMWNKKTTDADGKETETKVTQDGCILTKYCGLTGNQYNDADVAEFTCPAGKKAAVKLIAASVAAAIALMTQL